MKDSVKPYVLAVLATVSSVIGVVLYDASVVVFVMLVVLAVSDVFTPEEPGSERCFVCGKRMYWHNEVTYVLWRVEGDRYRPRKCHVGCEKTHQRESGIKCSEDS